MEDLDLAGTKGVMLVRDAGGKQVAKRYVMEDFTCKYCGSANIVLYGKYQDKPRWWCKDCKRKFAQNMALPRMKSPVTHVGSAIQQYYDGLSFNEICRNLDLQFQYKPANSTVYRWLDRFTRAAIQDTKKIHPNVGDEWICDETMLVIGGEKYWFWDCIDSKTRFLLNSRLVKSRGAAEARELLEGAAERAGKIPKVIVTDQLGSYVNGVDLAFGSDAKHIQGGPFNVQSNTNLIERFHGSLKDRTKVLRGLKHPETARLFLQGWLIHYNYFRPHIGLDGKTPASKAGVKYEHKTWLDLIKSSAGTAPLDTTPDNNPTILVLHHPPEPKGKSSAATLGRFADHPRETSQVTIREVESKPTRKRKNPRFTIGRERTSKIRDLGADIVRDRRGTHLRLS